MADVFLSYKREDNEIAGRIVAALRESGLSVWWDDGITPRQAWDTEIELASDLASPDLFGTRSSLISDLDAARSNS